MQYSLGDFCVSGIIANANALLSSNVGVVGVTSTKSWTLITMIKSTIEQKNVSKRVNNEY